jgi:glucose/arabinose dehydrogenase
VRALALAVMLHPAFGGKEFPKALAMLQAPGRPEFYVVEQDGKVVVPGVEKPFLDLRGRVRYQSDGEEGLLSLVFDPAYAKNHYFYILYSVKDAKPRRTRLSRFKAGGPAARPYAANESEKVLFETTKKHSNHNGGTLLFGPDGALYVGLGDGGGAGDQDGNAQNLESPLGKILRLDPKKNFAYDIWASGLRNPWRMSFDRETGELWVGDVGQDKWEEVDLVRQGGNYGWNFREGAHRFKGDAPAGLQEPILDYGRDEGFCVTGGYVYRGTKIPALRGKYVFGDYGSRAVWAWDPQLKKKTLLLRAPQGIPSFAEDGQGELYVIGSEGQIFELKASSAN